MEIAFTPARPDVPIPGPMHSPRAFPAPALRITRAEVVALLERAGLGQDEVGLIQDVTFRVDGTVEVDFIGETVDDVKIDRGAMDVYRSRRVYRLAGS